MKPKQNDLHFVAERFMEDFRLLLPGLHVREVELLMDSLSDLEVVVIKPPASGLIMINGRDCFDVEFHLGEVLVTTAEVSVNGIRGHATVMGNEPSKALLAASVMAVLQSGQDNIMIHIATIVENLKQALLKKRRMETLLTASTKVNFAYMAKEDGL